LMALEPAMHNNLNSALSFAIMCSIAAILAILIWSAIWKGKVHGSGSFFGQSVRKAGLCMGVPILVIACLPTTPWLPGTDFLFVVPFVGWGAWMVWTVCGWPIALADGEETAPPRCPNCGYSLTGLRWTRCPECGDEPTLDELWRATARQEV